MNNIVKYIGILPLSLFALFSQGVMAQEAAEADTINVAFRQSDARDVIVPVSTVNVKDLLEKNYNTYSLDNMQALVAGYNGQLWNQGDALVMVDGVPRDNMSDLNPSDIASVQVLKDASSSAIYGSRGASGVVLIEVGVLLDIFVDFFLENGVAVDHFPRLIAVVYSEIEVEAFP